MTNILRRLFLRPLPLESSGTYASAMSVSGDLVERMRETSQSRDPARALMADIWQQRYNVPFMTTVHEAVREMTAPFDGTSAKPPPAKPDLAS